MEELVGDKVRAIGVSNFSIDNLEKLSKTQKIPPAVNQIEVHPLLPQNELIKYCQGHDILGKIETFREMLLSNSSLYLVTAYSPLGSTDSPLINDEVIVSLATREKFSDYVRQNIYIFFSVLQIKIAEKHDATTAQILIAWGIKRGYAVIPKSITPSRIISNLHDVNLSDDDFDAINELIKNKKQIRLVGVFYIAMTRFYGPF